MYRAFLIVIACLSLVSPSRASAVDVQLVIENHKFVPEQLHVPAGQRVRVVIDNRDASAEEFDSFELNREKVIPARSKAIVWIGPLKPGHYPFMGEFNAATARGTVIAQ